MDLEVKWRAVGARAALVASLLAGLLVVLAPDVNAAQLTWTGGGTTDNWSDGANWAGGVAPVDGDHLVFGPSAARPSNVNDIVGLSASLEIDGNYTIDGNELELVGSGLQAGGAGSIDVRLPLSGSAPVGCNFPFFALRADNTYTGATTVTGECFLTVYGQQPSSAVTVSGAGLMILEEDGEGNRAVVGPVSVTDASISGSGTVAGGLALTAESTFNFNLDLPVGVTAESADLGGAELVSGGGHGDVQSATLLDLASPVVGRFAGLPTDGDVLTIDGVSFAIDYAGGPDGFDVTLTRVSTWTGGGTTTNWSDGANWADGAAPTAVGAVVFPEGPANTTAVNDLGEFAGAVTVSGGTYSISGGTLAGRLTVTGGSATVANTITGASATTVNAGSLDLTGDSPQRTGTINVCCDATLRIIGSVPSAPISANFSTVVIDGTSGPVTAVNSTWVFGTGTATGLTVEDGGARLIPGGDTTVGTLSVSGDLALGTLAFDGNDAACDQVPVAGTVDLTGATLDFRDFSSVTSCTVIDNDGDDPVTGTFTDAPEGATLTVNGAPYTITYAGGDGNDVVVSAGDGGVSDSTWTGDGDGTSWSDADNWAGDEVPASGSTLIFPDDIAVGATTHDLGDGFEADVQFPGSGGWSITGSDVLRLLSLTAGEGEISAPVDLGDGQAVIEQEGGGTVLLSGPMSGSADLRVSGAASAGYVRLTGAGSTFDGAITVALSEGQVDIESDLPTADVIVEDGLLDIIGTIGSVSALAAVEGQFEGAAALGGTGTISGDLDVDGGDLNGGDPRDPEVGTLTVTGDLELAGRLFPDITVDGADLLQVGGAVVLEESASFAPYGSGAPPGSIVLIANEGDDPVSGTFVGLPEGTALSYGEQEFHITYAGGDGNDVELTVATAATATWDGGSLLSDDWTDAANWVGDSVPEPGDHLVFPAGAAQLANDNDFPDGTPFALRFDPVGYVVSGNETEASSIVITSSSVEEATALALPLRVPPGGLDIETNFRFLDLTGTISGTGVVRLAGSFPWVRVGGDATGVPFEVDDSTGTLQVDGTVGDLTFSGFVLGGSGTMASLTMDEGIINAGTTVAGPEADHLTILGDATITGNGGFFPDVLAADADLVTVGGALLVDGAQALFESHLDDDGAESYTLIDGSTPADGPFDGFPEGAVVPLGGASYRLSYAGGADSADVTLTRIPDVVWSGGSDDSDDWTDGDNWVGGVAPEPGARLVFPDSPRPTSDNDFPDGTGFPIRFEGDHTVTGAPVSLLGLSSAVDATGRLELDVVASDAASGTLAGGSRITVAGAFDGRLELTGAGTLAFEAGASEQAFLRVEDVDVEVTGDRSGLELLAEGSSHITVRNASLPEITAAGDGTVTLDGAAVDELSVRSQEEDEAGRVEGTGTLGELDVRDGWTLAPGLAGPGELSIGDASLLEGTIVELDLTATDFDRLTVESMDVGEGVTLVLEGTAGAETYDLASATEALVGAPTTPADGATISVAGVDYTVDYTAEEGTVWRLTRVEDPPEEPTVTVGASSTMEGLDLTFAISISDAPASDVVVSYATRDDLDSASVDDYTGVSGTVTFTPTGPTSIDVVVPTTADDLDERTDESDDTTGNETVRVGIEVDSGPATLANGQVEGTIEDDDEAVLSIPAVDPVTEGATRSVAVSLSTTTVRAVSGTLLADGGTASEGSDFTFPDSAFTIAPGATTATADLAALADDEVEGDEVVAIETSGVDGAEVPQNSGEVTILDDDVPALSLDDATVDEGAGTATLTLALDEPAAEAVTVTVATAAGGTATAGDDHDEVEVEVTFDVDDDQATVEIPVNDDDLDELDETVVVTVTADDGASVSIADGDATLTIVDDDDAPTISSPVAVVEADESAGSVTVSIVLSEPRGFDTVLDWSTGAPGDTALAGEDYAAASGQLVVPAGETEGSVTIVVLPDTVDEPDEVFTVIFTEAAPAEAGAGDGSAAAAAGEVVAEAKVQIKDDDVAQLPPPSTPPTTAPPTSAPPGVAPSTTATPGSSPLPRTGTDIGPLVMLGFGLAAAGAVLIHRRRRTA